MNTSPTSPPRLTATRAFALLAALAATACGMLPGASLEGRPSGVAAESATSSLRVTFNDTYTDRRDINEIRARKNVNNTDKSLREVLRNARTSLDGAFYDIEEEAVVDEVIRAKHRGVRVRLVTDTDNMYEKTDPTRPRAAIRKLEAAGVTVVDDRRKGIMHHKFLVVDGRTIWTGSANLTPNSLFHHNNNALAIRSERLARSYTQEFERLFLRRDFGRSRGGPDGTGVKAQVAGSKLQVFFSPHGGGRKAVLEAIGEAKQSIRLMTFSLSDPETGALILKKAAEGVKVEGVFDRWLAAGEYSLFRRFVEACLDVVKDGNVALMHHKVIIVDDRVLVTGSYNYSVSAERDNNESFLVVRNSPAVVKAYVQEFGRVREAARTNRPPAAKAPDAELKSGEGP